MTSISTSKMTYQVGPFRPRSAAQKVSPGTDHRDKVQANECTIDNNLVSDRNAHVVATYHATLRGLLRRGFQ